MTSTPEGDATLGVDDTASVVLERFASTERLTHIAPTAGATAGPR